MTKIRRNSNRLRTAWQVMHGRRQLVVWTVPLSGLTSATLVVCYICHTRLPPLCLWSTCTLYSLWSVWFFELALRLKCFIVNIIYEIHIRRYRGGRKERMTPDQHGPLIPWAAHAIQWLLQREAMERSGANRNKSGPSSDCSLQLDCMKLESLVIAGHQTAVNTFSSLVLTARQVKGAGSTQSLSIRMA